MTKVVSEKQKERDALWNAWQESPSHSIRDSLLESYSAWTLKQAKRIFYKYPNSCLELADYAHWATIGLLESIPRFDPRLGQDFKAFAVFRVKGEILNNLSKISEQSAYASVRNKMMKERIGSLIERTNTKDTFTNVLDFITFFTVGTAIEELASEVEPVNLNAYHEDHLLKKKIQSSIEQLSASQRKVVNYYYLNQLSFVEISDILGVTKGRISQIHSEALSRLSGMISSEES